MNSLIPVATAPAMSEAVFAFTLILLLIAPLAIAGVALINVGLGRSRSAAQAMLGNLAIVAVAVVVFALLGTIIAGEAAAPGHAIHLAGKAWRWMGSGRFLFGAVAAAPDGSFHSGPLATLFELLAVALTALIPWGTGADRFRLAAGCVCAVVLAGLVFPFVACWTWGGGWLAQLGANFGLGAGFLDVGGAATIHVVGGLSALSVVWIAGPRKGKFPKEGFSMAMPGHNAVYVLFGCLLSLVGWLAWNAAGALLWRQAPLGALPTIAINTVLCASAAILATLTVTRFRFGKPDASMCANGWLAGLVASSASAALVTPAESLIVGLVAGVATPLLVELLELALSIDDPSGAISGHAVAGLWGLFAAGLFAAQPGQLLAQLVGIGTLLGLVLPVVYLLLTMINRVVPFRVDPDGERIGMDLHELGGGAYPEFVIHRDDSYR
jgi:ammonium transporter, Amt family